MDRLFGTIDLHMHSTVSDGTDPPEALPAIVKGAGIGLFALTDHDAFKGCEKLASIVIPASVERLQAGAFDNCKKLLDIWFLGDSKKYFEDSVLQAKTKVHASWEGTFGTTPKGAAIAATHFDPAAVAVEIKGPAALDPGDKAAYTFTMNGASATPVWSIGYGAKTAKVDKKGVVTAGKPDLAQTVILCARATAPDGHPVEAQFAIAVEPVSYAVSAVNATASVPAASMGTEVTVTARLPDGASAADVTVAWTFSPKVDYTADGLAATFTMPNKAVKATAKVTKKANRRSANAAFALVHSGITITWTARDGQSGTLHIVDDPALAAAILDADDTAQVALRDDAIWHFTLPAAAVLHAGDTALRLLLPDGTAIPADGADAPAGTIVLLE